MPFWLLLSSNASSTVSIRESTLQFERDLALFLCEFAEPNETGLDIFDVDGPSSGEKQLSSSNCFLMRFWIPEERRLLFLYFFFFRMPNDALSNFEPRCIFGIPHFKSLLFNFLWEEQSGALICWCCFVITDGIDDTTNSFATRSLLSPVSSPGELKVAPLSRNPPALGRKRS